MEGSDVLIICCSGLDHRIFKGCFSGLNILDYLRLGFADGCGMEIERRISQCRSALLILRRKTRQESCTRTKGSKAASLYGQERCSFTGFAIEHSILRTLSFAASVESYGQGTKRKRSKAHHLTLPEPLSTESLGSTQVRTPHLLLPCLRLPPFRTSNTTT